MPIRQPTLPPTPHEQRAAIGQRLRQARAQQGESQERFAARLGVTKLTLLTYEHGTSCPGAERLALLAQTGVDASYIAFGAPSLATPESRARFASVLEQVRRDSAGTATPPTEADLVEATWRVFSGATRQPDPLDSKNRNEISHLRLG